MCTFSCVMSSHTELAWFGEGNPELLVIQDKSEFHRGSPDIENLGNFIESFGFKHCQLIVDNFQRVDLAVSYALIIRTLTRLLLRLPKSEKYLRYYGPENIVGRNVTVTREGAFTCPLSKYFKGNPNFFNTRSATPGLCFHLNMSQYWRNIKPWNCQVQIDVYPPKFYYRTFAQNMWHRNYIGNISDFQFLFPKTSISSLLIFVLELPLRSKCCQPKSFKEAIHMMNLGSEYWFTYCQDLILGVTIQLQNKSSSEDLNPLLGIVESVRILSACRQWTLDLIINQSLITDIPQLTQISQPSPNVNLNWMIANIQEGESTTNRMVQFL